MAERTLLTIGQEAARRAGLPAPSTIYSNNEKAARLILIAADDTVREVREAAANNDGWGSQQVGGTITTISGRAYYDLPSDYEALIPGASFINGNPMWFMGPTDPYAWRAEEAGVGVRPAPYRWRIRGAQMFLQPTPSSEMSIYFEYLSRGMIDSTSDGAWDVAVWDDAVWNANTVIDRFLSDTDQPRFPDHILSLGITAKLKQAMGAPSASAELEYRKALSIAVARDKGGPPRCRTLSEHTWTDEVYHPLDDDSGVIIL